MLRNWNYDTGCGRSRNLTAAWRQWGVSQVPIQVERQGGRGRCLSRNRNDILCRETSYPPSVCSVLTSRPCRLFLVRSQNDEVWLERENKSLLYAWTWASCLRLNLLFLVYFSQCWENIQPITSRNLYSKVFQFKLCKSTMYGKRSILQNVFHMIVFVSVVICCTSTCYCSIFMWNVLNIRISGEVWYVLRDMVPASSCFHRASMIIKHFIIQCG